MGTPHRHLKAYLEARKPDRLAVLRFPPGVTLEDAGYDWASLFAGVDEPTLPADVLGRLTDLGVEVVATGEKAVSEALGRARAESHGVDPGAFVEGYLNANARLGGGRCVTVIEYAMHTYAGGWPLGDSLIGRLLERSDARVYGNVAFRDGSLPRLLSLRVWTIASCLLPYYARVHVPCLLHGGWCPHNYDESDYCPRRAISNAVLPMHLGTRVAVPRRLLGGMARDDDMGARRATRAVVRLILEALPDEAWKDSPPYHGWARDVLPMVAVAAAETCEEYMMLVDALRTCRSAREVVRRARDPSWAVSRALENLRDRR